MHSRCDRLPRSSIRSRGDRLMSRLLTVLSLLAAAGGPAVRAAQMPDSTRTFSSTHIDSTRIYYTQVVYRPRVDTLVDTLWCSPLGCSDTRFPEPPAPTPTALGVPFGPFALSGQESSTSPVAFTASQNYTSPENVAALIAKARA